MPCCVAGAVFGEFAGHYETVGRKYLKVSFCFVRLMSACCTESHMHAQTCGQYLNSCFLPVLAGPFIMILCDSLRGPGMKILARVFWNSLWGDLVEIRVKSLKRSLHGLVELLVRRSCGGPAEIPSGGPCIHILTILYETSGMFAGSSCIKILVPVLWRSPWQSFEILLDVHDVLVWGSGRRSWWVDIPSYRCFLCQNKFMPPQFRLCLNWAVPVPQLQLLVFGTPATLFGVSWQCKVSVFWCAFLGLPWCVCLPETRTVHAGDCAFPCQNLNF